MAKAKVELPNGKIATIEIPDGMSVEDAASEVQSMYDADPTQFDKAVSAPPAADRNVSNLLDESPEQGTMEWLLRNSVNSLQKTPMGQYVTGGAEQINSMGRGARQLFNKLTGDEEELAQLNAEEPEKRKAAEALMQAYPNIAKTGGIAAMIAPAALPGVGMGGAGLVGRSVAGALGGALGGGAQPLTTQEEQAGNREAGAIIGGTIGGLAPGVVALAGKGMRAWNRLDPDDALQKFVKENLGAERGGENLPAYREVGERVSGQEDALRQQFSQRYAAAERSAPGALPPVPLQATSQLTKEMPTAMSDELALALSPTARKTLKSVGGSSTHISPIVDKTGENFERPAATDFGDVRETIRELRRVSRVMMKNDATKGQAAQVARIEEALKDDLDNWSTAVDPVGPNRLTAARGVDADYREQMIPFQDQRTNLGKYGKTDQYDEQTLDRMFMNNQSGQALQDLTERVPGVEGPLRQIYGSKLLQSRGGVGNIRQLEGGTAGEALLSKSERDYLTQIADKLRDDKPNDLHLGLVSKAMKIPGIRKAVNAAMGVDPYQEIPKAAYKNQYLIDALRGVAAGQSAQMLEE